MRVRGTLRRDCTCHLPLQWRRAYTVFFKNSFSFDFVCTGIITLVLYYNTLKKRLYNTTTVNFSAVQQSLWIAVTFIYIILDTIIRLYVIIILWFLKITYFESRTRIDEIFGLSKHNNI